jgi:hypothetical protein
MRPTTHTLCTIKKVSVKRRKTDIRSCWLFPERVKTLQRELPFCGISSLVGKASDRPRFLLLRDSNPCPVSTTRSDMCVASSSSFKSALRLFAPTVFIRMLTSLGAEEREGHCTSYCALRVYRSFQSLLLGADPFKGGLSCV